MRESTAKNTLCPHFATAHALAVQSAILDPSIPAEDTDTRRTIVNRIHAQRIQYCKGTGCPMWEPEYEKVSKELPPGKEPIRTEGQEWRKENRRAGQPNTLWFCYKVTEFGDCGLKSKEQGCFYQ